MQYHLEPKCKPTMLTHDGVRDIHVVHTQSISCHFSEVENAMIECDSLKTTGRGWVRENEWYLNFINFLICEGPLHGAICNPIAFAHAPSLRVRETVDHLHKRYASVHT
jgi:hypothetical protein